MSNAGSHSKFFIIIPENLATYRKTNEKLKMTHRIMRVMSFSVILLIRNFSGHLSISAETCSSQTRIISELLRKSAEMVESQEMQYLGQSFVERSAQNERIERLNIYSFQLF